MRKYWIGTTLTITLALASSILNGQQPTTNAAAQTSSEDRIQPGAFIQAQMVTSIDAKKAHVGDTFEAKTWDDVLGQSKVVLPKGTKIIGHVLTAEPRTKDKPESKLALTFDKAVLKDGNEMPLRAVVLTVELSADAAAAAQDGSIDLSGASRGPGSTNGAPGSSGPFGAGNDRSFGGQKFPQKAKTYSPFQPTGVADPAIRCAADASGTLTVVTSSKGDVKIKNQSTIDLRITRIGE